MLNIDNKFGIGQKVYAIRKVRTKTPCSACNGEGHKIIDGHKFYCSRCNGEGYLRYETKKEYQVIGLKTVTLVKSITQLQRKEQIPQTVITYNVGNEGIILKEVPEHHLFVSYDEAITVCGELNRKMNEEESE